MAKTTDLELLKNGADYTWGKVEKILTIAEYDILVASTVDGIRYHPYINNKKINQSFKTLDEALVSAIAKKWDGNTVAADYFMKMIGAIK